MARKPNGEQEEDETENHSQDLRRCKVRQPDANHHSDDGGRNQSAKLAQAYGPVTCVV